MSEWWPQRRFCRYPIALPLLHRQERDRTATSGVGWTRDLSGGGACIELGERLLPRESFHARLRTDSGPIEVEARVVWGGEPPPAGGGIFHGVAFAQVAPDHLEVLRGLLLSLQPWRHTRGRLSADLPVTCQPKRPPGPTLRGRTGNLSRGGLLLRLPDVLPPFTLLNVTLHTPVGPLTLAGAIAWVEHPERRKPQRAIQHGLRFAALDWQTSQALARFLAQSLEDAPRPA